MHKTLLSACSSGRFATNQLCGHDKQPLVAEVVGLVVVHALHGNNIGLEENYIVMLMIEIDG